MDHFDYRDGQLYCEDVNIDSLVEQVGTPVYIYSKRTFVDHYQRLSEAFAELNPIVCYSIKSCGNIHICKLLAEQGSGMDVVSGGEVYRAQQAGADMSKVVYAGVGKTDGEIRAAIEAGIGWFNIESEAEFENISAIAKELGKGANAALRVNPDVSDARTHYKTTTGNKESKFGVDIGRAKRFFEKYGNDELVKLNAIHLHIGSPIYSAEPYVKAIKKGLALIEELRAAGHVIEAIDIGGGYAADYESGASPVAADYAKDIVPELRDFVKGGGKVILEPGRSISANAGILVTRVQYIKEGGSKKFVIVDGGMHSLIRVAMYDAFHFIWPTQVEAGHVPTERKDGMELEGLESTDVVGPICESSDVFAKDRALPAVVRGDLLSIFTAGAYGMCMANHYNAMPLPAEVLVDGDVSTVIRRRETYEDLVSAELNPGVV